MIISIIQIFLYLVILEWPRKTTGANMVSGLWNSIDSYDQMWYTVSTSSRKWCIVAMSNSAIATFQYYRRWAGFNSWLITKFWFHNCMYFTQKISSMTIHGSWKRLWKCLVFLMRPRVYFYFRNVSNSFFQPPLWFQFQEQFRNACIKHAEFFMK